VGTANQGRGGAEIAELAEDPSGVVSRDDVITLAALRAADRVGRACAEVLRCR